MLYYMSYYWERTFRLESEKKKKKTTTAAAQKKNVLELSVKKFYVFVYCFINRKMKSS